MNNENEKHPNLCASVYSIYLSIHEAILAIGELDPAKAFEYYKALANYNFYGEEYDGKDPMIGIMAKQQYPLIDKQRERYNKAVKGGQSRTTNITWEEIERAAMTGNYTTLQSLGVFLGTSGQNIGQRMQKKKTTLQQLIEKGRLLDAGKQIEEDSKIIYDESFESDNESFETKEPKVSQVSNLGKLSKEERLAKLTEQSNE